MKTHIDLFLRISNFTASFILLMGLYLLACSPLLSQEKLSTNAITVCDSYTKNPIAFATIQIGSRLYMTNVQGQVDITPSAVKGRVTIEHALYQQKIIGWQNNEGKSIIFLEKKYPFLGEKVTNVESRNFMQKVKIYQKKNNLKFRKNYSYTTYNKVTLTPQNDSSNQFDKIYKFLPKR